MTDSLASSVMRKCNYQVSFDAFDFMSSLAAYQFNIINFY